MININKYKFFLVQLLKDIYNDLELADCLGFKGGTALLLFYDLPRFSVDLDFNLLNKEKSGMVYEKIEKILLKYGTIKDKAKKHYGLLLVLDYGSKERNLKVEISNREFEDSYEIKNYLGINVRVMKKEDMFAYKLAALLDRNILTNRDIFDIWFFMSQQTALNKQILEARTGMTLAVYLGKCIPVIEKIAENKILNGLGELMDEELKKWVKNSLKNELISYLKMYQEMPIVKKEE